MIADAVRAELDQLSVISTSPGMAAVAIALAEALDKIPAGDAPTSKAVVARELNATMKALRAVAPVGEEGDLVDDLATRRAERRGA